MNAGATGLMRTQRACLYGSAAAGFVAFAIGFYCILTVPETHGKDLNYLEE